MAFPQYSIRFLLLCIMCVAAMVAIGVRLHHGKILIDRTKARTGGRYAITPSDIRVFAFKSQVLDYLDYSLPQHGFIEDDIEVWERTISGRTYREIYFVPYCVRRLRFSDCTFVDYYDDDRVMAINRAMMAAIDNALKGYDSVESGRVGSAD